MAFIIVGESSPIYELLDLSGTRREDAARNSQFILHAALDCVDLAQWAGSATYLKVVERHNDQLVSAYVTPGGARFMVLHDARGDDGVRAFCNEVHEVRSSLLSSLPWSVFARTPLTRQCPPPPLLPTHTRPPYYYHHTPPNPQLYIKALLNPFYAPGSRLDSPAFDAKVKQLARRYLGYP